MYYVHNIIFVYRLLCIKKSRRSVLQVPGSFAARSATDASVICDARVISPFGNVCRTWPFLRRGVQWHVWNIWDTEILKKMPYIFWEATNDRWESLFVVWAGKSSWISKWKGWKEWKRSRFDTGLGVLSNSVRDINPHLYSLWFYSPAALSQAVQVLQALQALQGLQGHTTRPWMLGMDQTRFLCHNLLSDTWWPWTLAERGHTMP